MTPLRRRMIEDLQIRGYSPNTIRAYVTRVAGFAKHFGKSPDVLGPEEIRAYQLYLVTQKMSWSTFNVTVCALRFLYEVTLAKDWVVRHIPYPLRFEKKIPVVLSVDEVGAFLQAIANLKHRTMFMVMYACGLRVSEVIKLQIADIDSERMVIHVRGGKGNKDRYVPLSSTLLEALRNYWKALKPSSYLFLSRTGKPMDPSTIQQVATKTRKKIGLTKRVTPHTMRQHAESRIMPTPIRLLRNGAVSFLVNSA